VHDVVAAARGGAHENHPAEDRRSIAHHLLRDHAAERESDDVATVDPDRVQKIQRVRRHLGYGAGNAAG
jgi:hypothetical protein